LTGHDRPVRAVAVGRLGDRDVIVSGDDDLDDRSAAGTVRIWDQDGQPVGRPLTGHDCPVSTVAVGRLGDPDVIVSGDADNGGGTVRIWDEDGQPVGRPLTGHGGAVSAVALGRLRDQDVIVSGGVDGIVRIWDLDGEAVGRPLTGHDGPVRAVAVGRLGSRDVIVSAGDDGTVRVWNDDGQHEQRLTTYASCHGASLCPSGEGAAIASGRSIISFHI
jgi:WD40 repeat protein